MISKRLEKEINAFGDWLLSDHWTPFFARLKSKENLT